MGLTTAAGTLVFLTDVTIQGLGVVAIRAAIIVRASLRRRIPDGTQLRLRGSPNLGVVFVTEAAGLPPGCCRCGSRRGGSL